MSFVLTPDLLPGMDVQTAVMVAKRCRPIIDPIGQLPDFLHRLQRAEEAMKVSSGILS
jgi:hypothetical protein